MSLKRDGSNCYERKSTNSRDIPLVIMVNNVWEHKTQNLPVIMNHSHGLYLLYTKWYIHSRQVSKLWVFFSSHLTHHAISHFNFYPTLSISPNSPNKPFQPSLSNYHTHMAIFHILILYYLDRILYHSQLY